MLGTASWPEVVHSTLVCGDWGAFLIRYPSAIHEYNRIGENYRVGRIFD